MRAKWVVAIALLGLVPSGCGGDKGASGPPGFFIQSGNWAFPISLSASSTAFAGGLLSQSGNKISGVLYITGSTCFDPVADALVVQGTVSSDANAPNVLTLTTSPVRGQVLTVTATWDTSYRGPGFSPATSPPNPVFQLVGSSVITGGACATTASNIGIRFADFNGTWGGGVTTNTGSFGGMSAVLSQTGPDAQGLSQISGTFTPTLTTPNLTSCFASGTTGTLASTTFAGDVGQMNVVLSSGGSLTGSAQSVVDFFAGVNFPGVFVTFVIHGGSCDGQTMTGNLEPPPVG